MLRLSFPPPPPALLPVMHMYLASPPGCLPTSAQSRLVDLASCCQRSAHVSPTAATTLFSSAGAVGQHATLSIRSRLPASLCLLICRRFACLPVCLLPRMWSSMHMHTLPRAYTIAPACIPLSRLLVPWSSVLPPAHVGAVLDVTVTCVSHPSWSLLGQAWFEIFVSQSEATKLKSILDRTSTMSCVQTCQQWP